MILYARATGCYSEFFRGYFLNLSEYSFYIDMFPISVRQLKLWERDKVENYLQQVYIALSTYIGHCGYGHNSASRFSHLLLSLHQLQLPEQLVNSYFFGGRVDKIRHLMKVV